MRTTDEGDAAAVADDDTGTVDARRTALERAAATVGDRWTLLLVDALLAGPSRYSDLEQRVGGISPTVLAARLRQLEDTGLVVAEQYQRRPVRHDYRLTDRGRALAVVLDLLAAWGDDESSAVAHVRCGTPLVSALWCPTCGEPVDLADGDEQLVHL